MATTRLVLTPEAAHFPSSAFAGLSLSNQRPVLTFDAAAAETAYWTFLAPQGLTGALSAVLFLAGSAAGTNAVYMRAYLEAVTPADALNIVTTSSFDTANAGNVSMPSSAGYLTTITITLTNADSIAAGDLCRLSVDRDATNASDTYASDALLFAVELREA